MWSPGPFAIAYATSLILGYDPINVTFQLNSTGIDESAYLRKHIKRIFENGELIAFPTSKKDEI